jgi:hypothetical protein
MIKGNIATPNVDPKTWRKGRKKRSQPAIAAAIVTPAKVKERGHTGSAIVEQKQRSGNSMLAHLSVDITDEERNRRADMADEMFRELRRRAALPE